MASAIRSVCAVMAGFLAASVIMMVVETINGQILYPDLGKSAKGLTDPQQIKDLLARAPVGAFLVVLFGWALGSLCGGFVTALLSRTASLTPALVLGFLLTLAGAANNLMLPPPVWFWFASLAVLLPPTYFGAKLARRNPQVESR